MQSELFKLKDLDNIVFDEDRLEFLRFGKNQNRIVILSEFIILVKHWSDVENRSYICLGKEECKYHDFKKIYYSLCYVYDLEDEKIKLAEMPYTIMYKLSENKEKLNYYEDIPYDIINISRNEEINDEGEIRYNYELSFENFDLNKYIELKSLLSSKPKLEEIKSSMKERLIKRESLPF